MIEFEIAYSKVKGFYKRELTSLNILENEGEVLIRPKRVGICGSDLFYKNLYKGDALLLGHEWVGEVVASNSAGFRTGDMVSSCAVFGCGTCGDCLNGEENLCLDNTVLGSEKIGMLRSIVVIHERNLIKLNNLSWDSAALLEVAAIGDATIYNLKKICDEGSKEVLILGAGAVGLMSALAARREGLIPVLVDTEAARTSVGKKIIESTFTLGELLLSKRKFLNIIDCTGDSNQKSGGWKYLSLLVKPNAKCLVVGHYEDKCEFDSHLFGKFSLTIKWMKGMSREFYESSIPYWESEIEKYKDLFISEKYSIEETEKAFESATIKNKSIKTMVVINE